MRSIFLILFFQILIFSGCQKKNELPIYTIPPDTDVAYKFKPSALHGTWRVNSILDNGVDYASLYVNVLVEFTPAKQLRFVNLNDSLLLQRSWYTSADSMNLYMIANNELPLYSRFHGIWSVVQVSGQTIRIKEYKNGALSKHFSFTREDVIK